MNDVIPGATYYDRVFGTEAICHGMFENEEGEKIVKLEYVDRDMTVGISYDLFREESTIEFVEGP